MSSRERLFSEADEADWESGEGRTRRGAGAAADDGGVVLDAEVDVVAVVGKEGEGRILVAVDVEAELDAEPVRMWGCRRGLGVVEEDGKGELVGIGELRAEEPRELECALWLELVRWRW